MGTPWRPWIPAPRTFGKCCKPSHLVGKNGNELITTKTVDEWWWDMMSSEFLAYPQKIHKKIWAWSQSMNWDMDQTPGSVVSSGWFVGAKDVGTQRDRLEIGTQLANAERRQGRDPHELFHSRGATEEARVQGGTWAFQRWRLRHNSSAADEWDM